MYAHAHEDIKELVQMEQRATLRNEDILDLGFVLNDPELTRKHTLYFWGWELCFFAITNGQMHLRRCIILLTQNCSWSHLCTQIGVQTVCKQYQGHIPKHVFEWIVPSRNIAGMYFALSQKGKETFVISCKNSIFHRMFGNNCVIII